MAHMKLLWNVEIARHISDGATPMGSMLLDAAGNVYGTATGGGTFGGGGVVFEITP